MAYADAHSHLCLASFDGRREEAITRAEARGIRIFVQGGYGPEDWDRQRDFARAAPGRYFTAYGLHPWWVAERSARAGGPEEARAALAALAERAPEADAVGELGLDRGKRCAPESFGIQREIFRAQLALALRLGKPLVLHVVKAHGEALAHLRETGVPRVGGLVHAFGGTPAQAREYRALGLVISVGAGVLRPGYEGLKKTVAGLDLDGLALESDEEEPVSLWETAAAVARLRGEAGRPCTPEDLLKSSTLNVARIFGKGT